ncbi:pilus assembly protein CpaF [Alkalibaculum bacchi]|uniref:Pilus assembly protein CpaF n=1 Tax=Alkalibaculum bacchi TaxID=645887 RepID=A0A366I8Y5_9FIRM|nr:CpaF family protein [Alkalibaculum bacchi]RBP65997.1 pilus assembly protein CpaF [Alkalibaculum bacchi]
MAIGVFGKQNGFDGPEEKKTTTYPDGDISSKRKKELDQIANVALSRVIDNIIVNPQTATSSEKKVVQDQVMDTVNILLEETRKHLSLGDKQNIANSVMDEIFGYGPITTLLNDETVSEVMVNSIDSIYVERSGKLEKTPYSFRDQAHIMHTIDKIISPLGRRVDESSPMVDARLPDGSRVNIIIPPLALKGPTITIRKFSVDPLILEDLISFGTLSQEMATLLKACVRGRVNILVSGGTGSGKTTLLNILSGFIPSTERIVTIEDAAELQLQQDHVVTLEARPANMEGRGKVTTRDLVVNSLRMRPDRIIVGEVRSGEALDMLQAMNTGHDGSLTTVHANTPKDSLSRLETMVMMSGMELPSRAIKEQIASAINLIIQVARLNDGSRKVTKVTEITGMEGQTITTQDIYTFEQEGFDAYGNIVGRHVPTGIVPACMEKIRVTGESIPPSVFIERGNPQRRF